MKKPYTWNIETFWENGEMMANISPKWWYAPFWLYKIAWGFDIKPKSIKPFTCLFVTAKILWEKRGKKSD